MTDAGDWCLIESDPGVFTELISGMGCRGVQTEEIYSLDPEFTDELGQMYGLIFLFKWQNKKDNQINIPQVDHDANHVFFANQVINNACATQAILSILLNRDDIDIGEELRNFKEFTADFPPDMKGLAISNSELIRSVHNSFARSDPFVNEIVDPNAGKDQDVYHFIAFTPIHGALYELDGLSQGPINLGPCDENNWVEKANEAIKNRMESYGASELHFSLMALIRDRIEQLEELIEEADGILLSLPEDDIEARNRVKQDRLIHVQTLQQEKEKRKRWHRENILRKHNFIPMIYNLLKHLSEKDQLESIVAQAKEKAKK
ncbi:ubiquitin carboxyl-terminal hydrolase [Cokeromyces recurvatus]|uniref:ubiquitin carboxyl-terminal hydrolase n=1 Tax=Cokeromyces recurvatus TaxID=90255 RepID=UPI00221F1631|nr:ubiquitin carboxyl-terminal hydrolase [Cokeromyces recurvatus]KAI7904823.1 ubiquitin carboxyl-terminal hydrolase [Cokeromyces recurvatus]